MGHFFEVSVYLIHEDEEPRYLPDNYIGEHIRLFAPLCKLHDQLSIVEVDKLFE